MGLTAFKRQKLFQDVLCCRDYAERVVVRFDHKVKSEYYGGNRSVYIEVISLKYFSVLTKANINSTTKSRQRHAVFNYF